jgi:hypothetical protein
MRLLEGEVQFSASMREVDSLIDRKKRLPEEVFLKGLSNFLFFDFHEILSADFITEICDFVAGERSDRFVLAVLDPDPVDYFFKNFDKYPIIEATPKDNASDFAKLVSADPGGSPADAIAFNSNIIVVYADSGGWAIYGDRELELAIAAFKHENEKQRFLKLVGENCITNVRTAIDDILGLVYITSPAGVPAELRDSLEKNYS